MKRQTGRKRTPAAFLNRAMPVESMAVYPPTAASGPFRPAAGSAERRGPFGQVREPDVPVTELKEDWT